LQVMSAVPSPPVDNHLLSTVYLFPITGVFRWLGCLIGTQGAASYGR
jgi:hypothetical protein